MDWYHEVSENWLKARKTVITATEIKGLVATYKRMSKKDKEAGVVSPAFAALWGDKSSTYPIDVSSYGPAARGHIMEPYAIDEFNMANEVHFHHWDDCIIANGLVGFSPDAMDIAQVTEDVKLEVNGKCLMNSIGAVCGLPERILEVKSFEPAQHMKAIATPKMKRDQLMQLAVAFHVVPTLKTATLLFFCPAAAIPMYSETYTADDLHEEIEMVDAIAKEYERTKELCEKLASTLDTNIDVTEEKIWQEHMETRKNNSGVFNVG